jgi:hypothetical protein
LILSSDSYAAPIDVEGYSGNKFPIKDEDIISMNKKKITYISNVVITKSHTSEIQQYTNEIINLNDKAVSEKRGREKGTDTSEKNRKSEKSPRSLSPVQVRGISTIEMDSQEPMAVYGVGLGEISPFSDVPGNLSELSKKKLDSSDNFGDNDLLSSNHETFNGNNAENNDTHDMSNFNALNSGIKSNLIDHNNPTGGFLLSKYVRDIGMETSFNECIYALYLIDCLVHLNVYIFCYRNPTEGFFLMSEYVHDTDI